MTVVINVYLSLKNCQFDLPFFLLLFFMLFSFVIAVKIDVDLRMSDEVMGLVSPKQENTEKFEALVV